MPPIFNDSFLKEATRLYHPSFFPCTSPPLRSITRFSFRLCLTSQISSPWRWFLFFSIGPLLPGCGTGLIAVPFFLPVFPSGMSTLFNHYYQPSTYPLQPLQTFFSSFSRSKTSCPRPFKNCLYSEFTVAAVLPFLCFSLKEFLDFCPLFFSSF